MRVGTNGLQRGDIRSSVPSGVVGVGCGISEEVVARQRELNEILEMQAEMLGAQFWEYRKRSWYGRMRLRVRGWCEGLKKRLRLRSMR